MNILIKNCYIIGKTGKYSVSIRDRKISSIIEGDSTVKNENFTEINADGLYLSAGFIDMHCHLREPGFEHKEDFRTGTAAAAAGGYTTVLNMANVNPVPDNSKVLKEILNRISEKSCIGVLQAASVTRGMEGKELNDFPTLKSAGAAAFSDDGRPVTDSRIMLSAMKSAKECGLPIISHCEELTFASGAVDEHISDTIGVSGISPLAEELNVAREALISYNYRLPIHIAHISTKASVNIIRCAKSMGAPITAETCPHYFSLTCDDTVKIGVNAKMNPPLRTEEDRKAIIAGLCDGTVDVISTDHAPHTAAEKAKGINDAQNGIIGLETAFSLSNTYLVKTGIMTLEQVITKLTVNPAKILKIDKGQVEIGKDADLVLLDINKERRVDVSKFKSKSSNSPYDGMNLYGEIVCTIFGGNIIYDKKSEDMNG